jgi:hypothetical protein
VAALMTRMRRSWTRSRTRVPASDADVVEASLVPEGDESCVVDAVGADPVVGVGRAVAGDGLGPCGVGGCGGGAARE